MYTSILYLLRTTFEKSPVSQDLAKILLSFDFLCEVCSHKVRMNLIAFLVCADIEHV